MLGVKNCANWSLLAQFYFVIHTFKYLGGQGIHLIHSQSILSFSPNVSFNEHWVQPLYCQRGGGVKLFFLNI